VFVSHAVEEDLVRHWYVAVPRGYELAQKATRPSACVQPPIGQKPAGRQPQVIPAVQEAGFGAQVGGGLVQSGTHPGRPVGQSGFSVDPGGHCPPSIVSWQFTGPPQPLTITQMSVP